MAHFEDVGPCVVLASPGMLQNGLSRELFEQWCTDSKNGCIIAGYCVEGTLAKVIKFFYSFFILFLHCFQHILSEPEEIVAINGERLPMRMQVNITSILGYLFFKINIIHFFIRQKMLGFLPIFNFSTFSFR